MFNLFKPRHRFNIVVLEELMDILNKAIKESIVKGFEPKNHLELTIAINNAVSAYWAMKNLTIILGETPDTSYGLEEPKINIEWNKDEGYVFSGLELLETLTVIGIAIIVVKTADGKGSVVNDWVKVMLGCIGEMTSLDTKFILTTSIARFTDIYPLSE